jgi:hypothetical protein
LLNHRFGEKEETKKFFEFSSLTLSSFDPSDAESETADPRLQGNIVKLTIDMKIRTLDQLIEEYGLPH